MTTVKKQVRLSGRGIHSGAPVSITVKPSDDGRIIFVRTDLDGARIPATFDNVGETRMRNTTVGNPAGAHVQTIEHLMAALFMAGIDSAVIEIDGPETPILDGSAAQFYNALALAVGRRGEMRKIIVRRPVVAHAREITRTLPRAARFKLWLMNLITGRKNDGFVKLAPNGGGALEISARLIYREKIIGDQSFEYSFDGSAAAVETFVRDIARARTFGKYSEWEYLKARGMGRGADETNVIALNDGGDGTLNPVLWPDEFVRHKIIDAVGDMYTAGGWVAGRLESYKGSHALNNLVLKKLFSNPANYDIVEMN